MDLDIQNLESSTEGRCIGTKQTSNESLKLRMTRHKDSSNRRGCQEASTPRTNQQHRFQRTVQQPENTPHPSYATSWQVLLVLQNIFRIWPLFTTFTTIQASIIYCLDFQPYPLQCNLNTEARMQLSSSHSSAQNSALVPNLTQNKIQSHCGS